MRYTSGKFSVPRLLYSIQRFLLHTAPPSSGLLVVSEILVSFRIVQTWSSNLLVGRRRRGGKRHERKR